MSYRNYQGLSRSSRYSILFALPLLLSYQAMAWLLQEGGVGFRNGADVLLQSIFQAAGGRYGLLLLNLLLLAGGAWLIARDWKWHPGPLSRKIFLGMLAESALLGLLIGLVVARTTSALLHLLAIGPVQPSMADQIMLSLGAGFYEELVFRVLLVGGLTLAGQRVLGWKKSVSGLVAAGLGALLFSAFHYIGPYGYPLELSSFLFRTLAGLVFSGIYLVRGFGIAAWSHALYDIFVTLAG